MFCEYCKDPITDTFVWISQHPAHYAHVECVPEEVPVALKDHSALFRQRRREREREEFPEFSDALDFFDAHDLIET